MKVAQWLVGALFTDFSDADQRVTCIYGCELCLYTILSTLGLLLLGAILQSFGEAVIVISIFYSCQRTGGGFHASSHARCFLTMVIGLLIGLIVIQAVAFQCMLPYIFFLSIIILLLFPLRLHSHKQYLKKNEQALCRRSYLATLCIAICIVGLGLLEKKSMYYAGCIATCLAAISRLCARNKA